MFVTVTVCGALVDATVTFPNANGSGVTRTRRTAMPVSDAVAWPGVDELTVRRRLIGPTSVAVGANVAVIVHEALGASAAAQPAALNGLVVVSETVLTVTS